MAEKKRIIIILLLSLISLCGISLKIGESGFIFEEPQSFLMMSMFFLIAYGLYWISSNANKRMVTFSLIPALIMSVCHLLGVILDHKGTVLWLLRDYKTIMRGILMMAGYGTIQFVFVYVIIHILNYFSEKARFPEPVLSKKSFPIIWVLLFLVWMPCFLNQFPAIMTADTTDQLEMALGLEPVSDHHPYFYTLVIKSFIKISQLFSGLLAGDVVINQRAAALFILFQMLCMTAVCAAVVCMISGMVPCSAVKYPALLFFLFYPVHAVYSVTMWKDVPFAVCLLALSALLFCELKCHRFIRSIMIGIAGILLTLFRHNGIYVILLTLPFIIFVFRHQAKPVLIAFIVVVLFYGCWTRILLPVMNVPKGRISEAFSIPLQQIALTAKRQNQKMDEKILEEIRYYFGGKDIWNQYIYRISDPVKNSFIEEKYTAEPARFWQLWMKLGITYPQDFADGFLLHTYGYWYPETPHWVFVTGIDDDGLFGIHSDPKLESKWITASLQWLSESKYDELPLLPLLFSPGACFWGYLILFFALVYRKSPAFVLCIPIFSLWLTALASPVNCEFRYVYGMFLCFPVVTAAILMNFEHQDRF